MIDEHEHLLMMGGVSFGFWRTENFKLCPMPLEQLEAAFYGAVLQEDILQTPNAEEKTDSWVTWKSMREPIEIF